VLETERLAFVTVHAKLTPVAIVAGWVDLRGICAAVLSISVLYRAQRCGVEVLSYDMGGVEVFHV
jgi:hypothetical protein